MILLTKVNEIIRNATQTLHKFLSAADAFDIPF